MSYGYIHRLRTGLSLVQPNSSPWVQGCGYDDYWRLQTLTSPAGTFTTYYKQTYAYQVGSPTASDLVENLYNPTGGNTYNVHDGLGRLLSTTLYNSSWQALNYHAYQYNDGHQRTSQTFLAGNFVEYTYDNIGQLKTAAGKESDGTMRPHEQFGYAYDKAWNLNYRTNNALVQGFGVNSLNELTTLSRAGNMTVSGAAEGAPTSVTVKDNANPAQTAVIYSDNTFARENVGLLNGNNTFTAVAEDAYQRKDTNTVSTWLPSSATCYYDARGNLTNDGRRVFYYDDENQLTAVLVSNAWKSEFVYDGMLRRRVRKEFSWSGGIWAQTNEVRYVYDGRLVVQDRHFTPTAGTMIPLQLVTYTRGNDLSGSLQKAGGIGGLLARTATDPSRGASTPHAYYHAEGNGNVIQIIDAGGCTVALYSYDPFGNVLAMSGTLAKENVYRFSSKEVDCCSGLVYFLHRYYEAAMQRWPNRDPINDEGFLILARPKLRFWDVDQNLYCFVANSPLGRVDPLGLQFGPGHGDGQCDVDKCKERCHEWADALAKQGGFNAGRALLNCFEGCDRNPEYVPGSPLPPLPATKPRIPKEPIWPLVKSCAKLAWEWCKGSKQKEGKENK